MYLKLLKILFVFFLVTNFNFENLKAEIIEKIEIEGNDRVSDETIKLFSDIQLKDDLSENDFNDVLKKLYKTNFFKTVDLKIENKILTIKVEENPIIENINFTGLKKKKLLDEIKKEALFKSVFLMNILLEKKKKTNFFIKRIWLL